MKVLFNGWQKSYKALLAKNALSKAVQKVVDAVISHWKEFIGLFAISLLFQYLAATWVSLGIAGRVILSSLSGLTFFFVFISLVMQSLGTKKVPLVRCATALLAYIAVQGPVASSLYVVFNRLGQSPSLIIKEVQVIDTLLGTLLALSLASWVYDNKSVVDSLSRGWKLLFFEAPFLIAVWAPFWPLYIALRATLVYGGSAASYLVMVMNFLWLSAAWSVAFVTYQARKKVLTIPPKAKKAVKKNDALSDEY